MNSTAMSIPESVHLSLSSGQPTTPLFSNMELVSPLAFFATATKRYGDNFHVCGAVSHLFSPSLPLLALKHLSVT